MAIQFRVDADVRQLRAYVDLLGKGAYRAGARALNDTITTVRAEGARAIRAKHKALRVGDIKRQMRVVKAFAHPKGMKAEINVSGSPLPLRLFRPTVTRKGVKATIGTERVLMGSEGQRAFFIAKYDDYFKRRNATGRAVKRIRGPSLPGILRAAEERLLLIAGARWPAAFRQRLQFEIEKAKRLAASRQ